MNDNHNENLWGEENLENNDYVEQDTSEYTDYDDGAEYDNGYEETREMNSVQIPKLPGDENYGIIPRDEFTELNSADDDMSKTRCMDSISNGGDEYIPEEPMPVQNPVKKRKKKKINHTRTMGQVFLGAVLSVTAIGLGVFLSVHVIEAMRDITGMAKTNRSIDFEITENMSVSDIVDGLHKEGIINNPSLMKMYINFTKSDTEFLNGPHTVNSNMSYNNILTSLRNEKEYTETIEVTIPEGLSVAEIGELLEKNYVCRASDFEAYVKNKQNLFDFEEGLKTNSNRMFMLEGYLFPDTYEFYVVDYLKKDPNYNTSTWAEKAAKKMMNNFEGRITKKMKARMKEMGMTLDETIILASLIQREGTNEENMAMISSVFHNRLNDPETFPNLQSDATYTYITETIRPRTNASNKAQMQKIEAAYDSDHCVGLPVGAICNPGLEAITAALYPDDTNYYYFLAARDGTFYWAETLEQHEQNIIDADLHADNESGQSNNEQ